MHKEVMNIQAITHCQKGYRNKQKTEVNKSQHRIYFKSYYMHSDVTH